MLTTQQMQEEILRLKKEKDFCILAHAYQTHDIVEIADFVGDSFGLSQQAQNAPQQNILMCGVRFMAETAKILSPNKRVILSHPNAGCPMAEQLTLDELKALREQYPDHAVVAYINTTSALKTLCDVCVTSASALKIVKQIPQKKIIFIPDCNLGAWIAEQVPEKEFVFIEGGCPIHTRITEKDVLRAREQHPNALLLVHPECVAEVTRHADFAGSTTAIMSYVAKSDAKEFVIGTDNSIVSHLSFDFPDKKFYKLSKICVCHDMRLTTLADVYNCLNDNGGEEIVLDGQTRKGAKRCIDNMLAYGG
ncbi:MAG: quinolinate synthase NadA [Ruminococcaceae bacterium]|nr:quinolinate synthase NadA [Oscillospiraceae bacterium]